MIKERIPRAKDELTIRKMMNHHAYRFESMDDLWHAMMVCYSGYGWWQGIQIIQNQFDLHRYFDLILKYQFEVILETGLQSGGSAAFFMDVLDLIGLESPYIGVDIDFVNVSPKVVNHTHNHIWVQNDCLAYETIASITPYIKGKKSLVILDSVHTKEHVDEELRLYAPLIDTKDSYLVISDSDHNGHPVLADYGPSAWEAQEEFKNTELGKAFEVDKELENRYGPFTVSPGGWLRKK